MDNQSAHLRNLFSKYTSGTANRAEVEELLAMLSQGKYDNEILSDMQAEMSNTVMQDDLNVERWSGVLDKIQSRIATRQVRKSLKLWPRIAAAAAIIMVVGVGIFYFNQKPPVEQNQVVNNDIDPGQVGATLTLASGKKIRLTDAANGEIAKEAGISVTKTADGQLVYEIKETTGNADKINTLSTAQGETYILTLPDKSKVWLNAASSLTYAANLIQNGQRRVKLTGEAYLEVAKDKAHPFIVQTDKQEVEVLGTHFNINSYSDEPAVATTLLEGSVKVTSGNNKQIIKPGEQAINNGKSIKVGQANIDNITDWKDNDFYLNRVEFRTAMRKIARWYNVEVVYDQSVPEDIESGGWISRNKKLSTVLKFIESSGQVHFRLEGRTVYVSK